MSGAGPLIGRSMDAATKSNQQQDTRQWESPRFLMLTTVFWLIMGAVRLALAVESVLRSDHGPAHLVLGGLYWALAAIHFTKWCRSAPSNPASEASEPPAA
ncbi:hypothetical protein ACQCSX_06720 [Pseudarthrobacter sp. P1]|uniref:hypothetical protein n=1 Tax=Pseudarthrobacter sp. P1 TaxID=3418418 RepID=UPI003CFB248B